MKILSTFLTLFVATYLYAQPGEFTNNDNGLIYSDNAVKELKHIVDSLNLKFKVCEIKLYRSNLQGKANYIFIEGIDATNAVKDIKAGMPFKRVSKKYPNAKTASNLLVTRKLYKDYKDNDVLYLDNMAFGESEFSLSLEKDDLKRHQSTTTGWFYEYRGKTKYSEESVKAFYFDKNLTSIPIAEKYAKLVQYSDCLIDTTALVYLKKIDYKGGYYLDEKKSKSIIEFLTYIEETLKKPKYEEFSKAQLDTISRLDVVTDLDSVADTTGAGDYGNFTVFYEKLEAWDATRLQRTDSLMRADEKFRELYDIAYNDAVKSGVSLIDEFEEYVARYTSKEQALFFKRKRRVVGGCSMDDSPRRHAMNIAELAGETAKWEIFLRSHLDIMNDRFERVSDGSYAQAGRKTYIKELEVLDINVNDLLLGICLRVENAAENHYYGSIGRIGRSLSESKDRQLIEKEVLGMIKDKELDDYNRMLMCYLFLNYNQNLDDELVKKQNFEQLKNAVAYMPDYLSSGFTYKE